MRNWDVHGCGHTRLSTSCMHNSLPCNFKHEVIFAYAGDFVQLYQGAVDTLALAEVRCKARLVCVMFVHISRVYVICSSNTYCIHIFFEE